MADKSPISNVFGTPQPEPMTTLISLVADMSAMSERLQSTAARNAADIAALTVRAESIDKTIEALAAHDVRLRTLERDLIVDGETRLRLVEKAIDGRRRAVIGLISSALIGTVGFLSSHYFDAISTWITALVHH